jgi:hypothetical protein
MDCGASSPSASSIAGTMSMACAYWLRTSPRARILAGHETTNGSVAPPRYVSRFQRRNGLLPAQVQP